MSNENLAAEAVASKVLELASQFGTSCQDRSTDSVLRDCGFDHLDAVELIAALEEAYEVELADLPADEAELLALRLQDIVDATMLLLAERPAVLVPGSTVTLGGVEFEVSEEPTATASIPVENIKPELLEVAAEPQATGATHRVKIDGDGTSARTRIIDATTGEAIRFVQGYTVTQRAGELAKAVIEVSLPKVELECDAEIREAATDPRREFEAWVISEAFFGHDDQNTLIEERDEEDGGYIDAVVHGAWMAWNQRGGVEAKLPAVQNAAVTLRNAMSTDLGLAWAWHCVMACSATDAGASHKIANEAAARSMQMLFDVDTRKHPGFRISATDAVGAAAPAPKLTLEDIEAVIVSEHYFTAGEGIAGGGFRGESALYSPDELGMVTFCVLILLNGTKVTGVNHGPVSAANFDAAKGREYARADAIKKVWELEGYALRERLANPQATLEVAADPDKAAVVYALRQAVDAMRAFTDPEGNMPANTGEFNDLKAALAEAEAVLAGEDVAEQATDGGPNPNYNPELDKGADLLALVSAFVEKHHISCPEVIHQADRVIENAYEFIEELVDVAGYLPEEDEA